jgi:hypothetical protein
MAVSSDVVISPPCSLPSAVARYRFLLRAPALGGREFACILLPNIQLARAGVDDLRHRRQRRQVRPNGAGAIAAGFEREACDLFALKRR